MLVVGAFLFGLYLFGSLGLSRGVDLMRESRSGLFSWKTSPAGYSGIFDMDVMRVVQEWTGDKTYPVREPPRTHVHPLSRLALAPFAGSIHRWMGGHALDVARIVIACSLTVNALLTGWLTLQLAGGSLLPGLLATLVYGVSFSSILLGTIPDNASISCLSTTVPLIYLNRRLDRRFGWREAVTWGFLGVFCIAFTVSQIMHWLIAIGLRLFWLRRGRDRAAAEERAEGLPWKVLVVVAVFVATTWSALALQERLYPGIRFTPDYLRIEGTFFRMKDLGSRPLAHSARVAVHFLGYNFAAPFPGYSDYMIRKWGKKYWSLSLEEVRAADLHPFQLLLGAALLSLLVVAVLSLRKIDRRFLAPLLSVAGQFALHLAYGREYILYSSNWHGPLVAVLVAACWNAFESQRRRMTVLVLAVAAAMIVNNVAVLNRVYQEVNVGLEQWQRDGSGQPLAVQERSEKRRL